MSTPFSRDFQNTLKRYYSDPSKQLNLGYTVVSFWYTAAFYLGAFLIAISLAVMILSPDYANGNKTKSPFVYLAWVGFGLILFSLWSTIGSFYGLVEKIDLDVRSNPKCSFFQYETPKNAIQRLVADNQKNSRIETIIASRGIATVSSEVPDASSLTVDTQRPQPAALPAQAQQVQQAARDDNRYPSWTTARPTLSWNQRYGINADMAKYLSTNDYDSLKMLDPTNLALFQKSVRELISRHAPAEDIVPLVQSFITMR